MSRMAGKMGFVIKTNAGDPHLRSETLEDLAAGITTHV